jgi:hypothetical protein
MERIYCLKKALEGLCTWTSTVSLTRFVCSNLEMPFLIISLIIKYLKGLTFEKPELVPFRLTQNMIDAFGAYGHSGKSKGRSG